MGFFRFDGFSGPMWVAGLVLFGDFVYIQWLLSLVPRWCKAQPDGSKLAATKKTRSRRSAKCQITPPVQLSHCKIANFLINKSTELPNLRQGQTKQVVSVECQFLRVFKGTQSTWEKSECKLLVEKLAISKVKTKAGNVPNLLSSFENTCCSTVLPC